MLRTRGRKNMGKVTSSGCNSTEVNFTHFCYNRYKCGSQAIILCKDKGEVIKQTISKILIEPISKQTNRIVKRETNFPERE